MSSPRSRLLIGLMSGTSVDGIDAALVRFSGRADRPRGFVVLGHVALPWPEPMRKRLWAVMAPAPTTTQEICDLNVQIAREFARAVERLLRHTGMDRSQVEAIGSHGQTVCHLPPHPSRGRQGETPQNRDRQGAVTATQVQSLTAFHGSHDSDNYGSTLQLGDPSVLATLTGIQTVANFRPADMALGGQGAPLVPWTDAALLCHPKRVRCIQNIGGIANVTYLGKGQEAIRAFDTGPGNMLLDALISLGTQGTQRYDRNARLARRGQLDPELLAQLQAHPFFDRHPPKSTGREDFGLPLAQKLFRRYQRTHRAKCHTSSSPPLADLLYTATHLTAWSIAEAYRRFLPTPPAEVILCGGGADNPLLVSLLNEQLATLAPDHPPQLRRIDDLGIPNKAKEAASFALLAAATLDGIPANVPAVTGARRPIVLGAVTPCVSRDPGDRAV